MKKLLFSLFFLLTFTAVMAQAPQRISYQSIIRDANKVVVASSPVGIKISLLKDTATGPAVYVETHASTTNANGLVSLEIGTGTAVSGTFAGIDWSNGPYLIQTETDPTGGTNYSIPGIAALNSVPYALNAINAGMANKLAAPRSINGVLFDGSADITVTASAATLAGTLAIANGGTGATTATAARASLGLENVDNTSDANKPVSTDVQTALSTKVDKVTGKELSTNDYSTAEKTKLAAITGTNTGDQDLSALATTASVAQKANAADVTTSLATKVDKVTGKELSTNDYSTAEKTKLAAITGTNTGDQTNITGNAATATKLLTAVTINGIAFDGSTNVTIPTTGSFVDLTTDQTIGGVKTFSNILNINGVSVGSYSGNNNTMVGPSAFSNSTPGANNTALGYKALSNAIGGNDNTAIGADALSGRGLATANGWRNTAIGVAALKDGGGGADNVAIGFNTLANTTGGQNTGVGMYALLNNSSATSNVAVGAYAQISTTLGANNTSIGTNSMFYNTSGAQNTAIGNNAGSLNTTGTNNTAIGGDANFGANNLTNATAIGYGAVVTTNNTIQLGADGTNGTIAITNVKTSGTLTAGAITYPNTVGSTGQVLTTDGSGTASWGTPAAGLPTSGNTAGDMLYWNGTVWVRVAASQYNDAYLQSKGGVPTWTILGRVPTQAVDVTNPTTGKIWMDRNLGATQVATSSTDAASYGDLYQWGRGADGHQIRTSGTTPTLSSTDTPVNGNFILASSSPSDWRSPQNTNLWQGVNGVNNPCPTGYRIPTDAELDAERSSWITQNTAGAFASPLKLPMAGGRYGSNGSLFDSEGDYWSSTVSGTNSRYLSFDSSSAGVYSTFRSLGLSVRCLKD